MKKNSWLIPVFIIVGVFTSGIGGFLHGINTGYKKSQKEQHSKGFDLSKVIRGEFIVKDTRNKNIKVVITTTLYGTTIKMEVEDGWKMVDVAYTINPGINDPGFYRGERFTLNLKQDEDKLVLQIPKPVYLNLFPYHDEYALSATLYLKSGGQKFPITTDKKVKFVDKLTKKFRELHKISLGLDRNYQAVQLKEFFDFFRWLAKQKVQSIVVE